MTGVSDTTRQTTRSRLLIRAVTVLALVASSLCAVATPASAGTPYCRYAAWMPTSGLPIYIAKADGSWRCHMGYGAHSTAVVALQRSLNRCYLSVIGTRLVVDGTFGSKTRAALIRVQRHLHIRVDGIYGPQTALTMRHLARTLSGNSTCDTISHPGG